MNLIFDLPSPKHFDNAFVQQLSNLHTFYLRWNVHWSRFIGGFCIFRSLSFALNLSFLQADLTVIEVMSDREDNEKKPLLRSGDQSEYNSGNTLSLF